MPPSFTRHPPTSLKAPKRPLRPSPAVRATGTYALRPTPPTHAAFIEKICSLEGGPAGVAFSSGMAAETALVLSLFQKGDHLLTAKCHQSASPLDFAHFRLRILARLLQRLSNHLPKYADFLIILWVFVDIFEHAQ